MRPTRLTAAAVLATAAVVGVLIGLAIHGSSSRSSTAPGLPRYRGQAVWPAGSRLAPGFALRDQDGRLVDLSTLRGRPVLLAFMDSRCHEQCPLEGRAIAAGLRELAPAHRPELVMVSVDPWADTPSSARQAVRRWGLAGFDWRWLFGSPHRLRRVWAAYGIGVRRTGGDIAHVSAIYLLDAHGFERAGMAYPFLPGWVSHDLRLLAAKGSAS